MQIRKYFRCYFYLVQYEITFKRIFIVNVYNNKLFGFLDIISRRACDHTYIKTIQVCGYLAATSSMNDDHIWEKFFNVFLKMTFNYIWKILQIQRTLAVISSTHMTSGEGA